MPNLSALTVLGERMRAKGVLIAEARHQHFVDDEPGNLRPVLGRVGVGDGCAKVVPDKQDLSDAEPLDHFMNVRGQRALVITFRGLSGIARSAQVWSDDKIALGERRNDVL